MLTAQVHRGPDDAGSVSVGPATLGMRRLAVFDPVNGRQPMVSPDGRHHLVFDGAIYNFRELRAAYAHHGWVFRTECDAELLLAALALDGPDVLPRLRGMFAFALWDARENTLLLARDALGIKPLLYHSDPAGHLLFASESRALLASRLVPAGLDPAAAAAFLRRLAVPAPATLHAGVRALRPGERLLWREGRHEVSTWWIPSDALAAARPRPGLPPPAATVAALRGELRARVDDSIQAHLAADVPVAALLSGGPASAVVAALMARHMGGSLRTFSIGFEAPGGTELDEAAATARHLGAAHHTHVLTGAEVARDIEGVLDGLDQPTGDGIDPHYAARLARAGGIKVALSDLGADALFGSCPSFRRLPRLLRIAPAWNALPSGLRAAALAALRRGGFAARQLAGGLQASASPAALALAARNVFSDTDVRRLLAPSLPPGQSAGHPAEAELAAAWAETLATRSAQSPPPAALLASLAETRGHLAEVRLRDQDEFGLRHSHELRSPFVDLPLVEWAWAQSPALLHPPGAAPRAHLAAACADLLPPALLAPKTKRTPPALARWLRGPLRPFMEETLGSASAARSGLFDPYYPGRLWRAYRDSSDDRTWSRVWSLAVLIRYANRHSAA